MHGQFHRDLERTSADEEKILVCLSSSGPKGQTEYIIRAVQDQAFNMLYYQRNIL